MDLRNILSLWLMTLIPLEVITSQKFKAAVYEHAVIKPDVSSINTRAGAFAAMEENLAIFREQTRLARLQGAQIIVFPECGLLGYTFTRENIKPFLETIPDPREVSWSACDDPYSSKDTPVQHALSCMAKNNSIYLVANMGDVQPCNVDDDPRCPGDGQYQYNTAVAFAPNGTLVARYHKMNLYYEFQYDKPEVASSIYFDTPFGRVGLFICFDVLFEKPAVSMVERDNVTIVAFPTAWMDALPQLSAIGFHSSFARGLGVNFLAANLHIPDKRFQGSGIYGPDGAENFYFTKNSSSPGKLIIGDLDILKGRKPQGGSNTNLDINSMSKKDSGENNCKMSTKNRNTHLSDDGTFRARSFKDFYKFKVLTEDTGFVSVSDKQVKCYLNYTKQTIGASKDIFALGALDRLHTSDADNYYFQNCVLLRCRDANNRSSCGRFTLESQTTFSELYLYGDIPTPYVYPQLLLAPAPNKLALASKEAWTFDSRCRSIRLNRAATEPVLSAMLIGRAYALDNGNPALDNGNPSTSPAHSLFYITTILLAKMLLPV